MRIQSVFAALTLAAMAAVPSYASAAPVSSSLAAASARAADPAIALAANSVTRSRAIPKGKHKWTNRELRKGYYQQCGYDGYCTTIYNGT